MKRFIQQFSLAVSVSAMLFIGCAAPSDGDTPAGKENAGYVWGRAGVWNIGDAAAADPDGAAATGRVPLSRVPSMRTELWPSSVYSR